MRCTWAFCQEETVHPKGSLCAKHLRLQQGIFFTPKKINPFRNDPKAFRKRAQS